MKLPKEDKIILGVFILIIALLYAGSRDYTDNTQVLSNVIITDTIYENIDEEQAFALYEEAEDFTTGITVTGDIKLIEKFSHTQLSEIFYNTDREIWDTIQVTQILDTYELNPSYYDSIH